LISQNRAYETKGHKKDHLAALLQNRCIGLQIPLRGQARQTGIVTVMQTEVPAAAPEFFRRTGFWHREQRWGMQCGMISLIGVNVTPEPDPRSPGAPETFGQVQGTPRLVPGCQWPTPVSDTGRNAVALGPLDPSGWPKCLDFELKIFCFFAGWAADRPDHTANTAGGWSGGSGGGGSHPG